MTEARDERLGGMVALVESRASGSDQELLILLDLLLHGEVAGGPADRIERAALGFKYWLDEPGTDSMDFFAEHHQVAFAVGEYLAGQRWPDARFTNDSRTGAQHRERAERRLRPWLELRFRFGFSQWFSATAYLRMFGALVMLVEHADDEDLATRAAMVADLLAFDLMAHSYQTWFGPASAHARPGRGDCQTVVGDLIALLVSGDPVRGGHDTLAGVVRRSRRYRLPEVLRAIASDDSPVTVRQSTGLAPDEVADYVDPKVDPAAAALLHWAGDGFLTAESASLTARLIRRWGLTGNRAASAAPVMPSPLVRALNPIQQGRALGRANIHTHRGPHYQLSSVQHYRPGEFGADQLLWQALLPGGVAVTANHPRSDRQAISSWQGNGINPDIGQDGPALLAFYDLAVRPGLGEGRRHRYTHLRFPFLRFDETRLGARWVAGRSGQSLIGVVSLTALEMVADDELRAHGDLTGYAVLLSDLSEHGSIADFCAWLKQCPLVLDGRKLTWWTPSLEYELVYRRGLVVRGKTLDGDYPRLESPWGTVPRDPIEFKLSAFGHQLALNWVTGQRLVD